ncbi:MAG TPA: hypothetical protein VIG47_02245, partial [Gemmatimonadaceae bacterium]
MRLGIPRATLKHVREWIFLAQCLFALGVLRDGRQDYTDIRIRIVDRKTRLDAIGIAVYGHVGESEVKLSQR